MGRKCYLRNEVYVFVRIDYKAVMETAESGTLLVIQSDSEVR